MNYLYRNLVGINKDMVEERFETDICKLEKFLSKRFEKSNISYIGSGWSSHVFRVNKYLIRFPKQNLEDYLFEEMVCQKLKGIFSFVLPQVKLILDAEYPYAVHECIAGETLETKQGSFDNIALLKDCALALTQIHSLEIDEAIRKVPTDSKLDSSRLKKYLLLYFDFASVSEMCRIYDIIRMDFGEEQVFTHADFHPGNLLVNDRNRLVGVIDWCNSGTDIRHNDFRFLYFSMNERQISVFCEEYEKNSGIHISVDKIRQLALADLLEKIYWCRDNGKIEEQYLKKLRDYYNEFVFV